MKVLEEPADGVVGHWTRKIGKTTYKVPLSVSEWALLARLKEVGALPEGKLSVAGRAP